MQHPKFVAPHFELHAVQDDGVANSDPRPNDDTRSDGHIGSNLSQSQMRECGQRRRKRNINAHKKQPGDTPEAILYSLK